MRGIIFTEYLDFVESLHGYEAVDRIVSVDGLTDDGAYTSVGNYPYEDMVKLLIATSEYTHTDISDLMEVFGKHVMKVFYANYPSFFKESADAITFLSSIEDVIHPQVLKLYPDAELPTFDIVQKTDSYLEMVYHSSRKMGDFAHGLIEGCLEHYDETATVTKENVTEDGTIVRFTIQK
jgi:hypothetical protein